MRPLISLRDYKAFASPNSIAIAKTWRKRFVGGARRALTVLSRRHVSWRHRKIGLKPINIVCVASCYMPRQIWLEASGLSLRRPDRSGVEGTVHPSRPWYWISGTGPAASAQNRSGKRSGSPRSYL